MGSPAASVRARSPIRAAALRSRRVTAQLPSSPPGRRAARSWPGALPAGPGRPAGRPAARGRPCAAPAPLRPLRLLRPARCRCRCRRRRGRRRRAPGPGPRRRHVLCPAAELRAGLGLQPGGLRVRLFLGEAGGHRGVRLQPGAIAGGRLRAGRAPGGAGLHRLRQQRADGLLVPAGGPCGRAVTGVQPPADHPRPRVVAGGHLGLPGRPAAPAVAVRQQRRHHLRVIRHAALPVSPVARPGPRQAHLRGQLDHPPRQVPGRQPLPRAGRHQHHLVRPVPVPELPSPAGIISPKAPQNSYTRQKMWRSLNKRLTGNRLTESREKSPDSLNLLRRRHDHEGPRADVMIP
jgi:hypothetical protein